MSFKQLLILISVILSGYTSVCQNGSFQFYQNGYYIKQYSELAGLVNNGCKYTFEDSRGFLWISTFRGLSRFDGRQFVNYGLKEGLPGLNISQVTEDDAGFIYVATAKGIARYTGRQSKSDTCFYTYRQTTDLPSAISGMQVIDSSTIVFQRIGSGLYLLQNNKLEILSDVVLNFETSILKDRANNIYAYSKDTFRIYDKNLKAVKKVAFPASYFMTFYYDNISNIIHTYSDGKSYRLNKAGLTYAGPAPDSVVWLWKDNHADKIYYSKERTEVFVHEGTANTPIVNMGGLALFSNDLRQANDRSIWISTSAGGIFKINPLPYYEVKTANGVCFKNTGNSRIIESGDPLLNTITATSQKLKNCITRSAFISSNKTIWYATTDGIYKQEPGKNIEHYQFEGNENLYGPVAKEVKCIAEDAKGGIWFNGYPGLIRYNNGVFKQYTGHNGLNSDILIKQMAIEKGETVLVSDWYNLFMVQGDTLIKIDKSLGLTNYIPDKIVTDNNGFVWLDHNNKIFKLERTQAGNFIITDSIIPYTSIMPANQITGFGFDGNNNCWIGSNGGRIQVFFNDKNGHYTYANNIAYTIEDGLAPATGSEYYFFKNAEGNMVVVPAKNNIEQVFVFPVASALERKEVASPRVCITDMIVNQRTPDWLAMGYRTDPMGLPDHPELSFKNNDIIFNYTATSLRSQAGTIYRVMLKGYDKEWITTNHTSAGYTNLPPGDYCLMIKAASAAGMWSDTVQFNFVILKPWYKTWWALSLWTILIISLILLSFYIRLKAVRKEEALTHLKKSNQFKTTLITLIGHDMIIPLQYIGKVASSLEKYNEKLSRETLTESLGEISLTASQLQLFGQSIVQWIKVQNSESGVLQSSQFSVNDILNELVGLHSTLCALKGNIIDLKDSPGLSVHGDPFLIKAIVHNLLLNANKFTSEGTITVAATTEKKRLLLTVADTGNGMSKEKADSLNNFKPLDPNSGTNNEKGWGLGYTIIMDLLKISGGTLHVESKINEGTIITISLPLNND